MIVLKAGFENICKSHWRCLNWVQRLCATYCDAIYDFNFSAYHDIAIMYFWKPTLATILACHMSVLERQEKSFFQNSRFWNTWKTPCRNKCMVLFLIGWWWKWRILRINYRISCIACLWGAWNPQIKTLSLERFYSLISLPILVFILFQWFYLTYIFH